MHRGIGTATSVAARGDASEEEGVASVDVGVVFCRGNMASNMILSIFMAPS